MPTVGEISIEEMVKLIKGFVDILILATGYQSSGHLAHWDSVNINKAFQWGFFFENLFNVHLRNSEDFKKELDSAILQSTSNPNFPQGLVHHVSSVALTKATQLVLSLLLHTLPLRDAQLRAILTASSDIQLQNYTSDTLTNFVAEELVKRQFAVSSSLSAESCLEILSKTLCHTNLTYFDIPLSFKQQHAVDPCCKEQSAEYLTWKNWRLKSLSYMMNKRTLRMVSGASMIFSAPKAQWIQIFEHLKMLTEANDDLLETIEIFLLGCVSSRWNSILDHYMSVSYDSVTISKQYHAVHNLLLGRSQSLHTRDTRDETMDSKESFILVHLTEMLHGQHHLLWKLSPILAAIAIPSWSPLFKMYINEIESQFRGDCSIIRRCTCIQYEAEHRECELAERIACLYTFHILGSHVMWRVVKGSNEEHSVYGPLQNILPRSKAVKS